MEDRTEKFNLTEGDVWKKLFAFFLPVAAGAIVQQLYNTADGLIVGRFCGTAAFAAITGSPATVLGVLTSTAVSLTGGAAVYIAQLYGVGDSLKIKKAVMTSMFVSFIIGIALCFYGYYCASDILILLQTPADTLELSETYLKTCFLGSAPVLVYNMGAGIIRASGDSRSPFIYLCACCFTNIILDYVLVRIFNMGVYGAAAATAASQFISAALVLVKMLNTRSSYKFEIRFKNASLTAVGATLKYGIPSAAQQVLYGVTNIVIQVGINSLGTANVAAWSLTSKVDGIYWAIVNSIGIAVMNFAGQNYGAGKLDRVRECEKQGMKKGMLFTLGMAALLILTGKFIMGLFVTDEAVIDIAYKCSVIFLVTYPAWTVIEVISGVLKGCGDIIVPSFILLIGIVGIRLLWFKYMFMQYRSIYILALAYSISWIATALILFVRYKRGRWKKRREL